MSTKHIFSLWFFFVSTFQCSLSAHHRGISRAPPCGWKSLYRQNVSAALFRHEIWTKPQSEGKVAILMMNNDHLNRESANNITVYFDDIPWIGPAEIRDIVHHRDLGQFRKSYTAINVQKFATVFLLFSPPWTAIWWLRSFRSLTHNNSTQHKVIIFAH